MTCPGCGIQHLKDFKFCPECGERLAAAPPAPEPEQTAAPAPRPVARLDEAAQAARLLEQAFELYDEGRYGEALGCCQASAALDPTASTAHSLLGMIYERLGKTADAVHQYRLVLQMNPDSIADAVKLEALQGRGGAAGPVAWIGRLLPISRMPAAAGAIVAAVALVVGIWATSRALGQGSSASQRMAARSSRQAVPGASMPRPSVGMPGAEETFAPPRGAMPSVPAAGSSPGAAGAPAARPLASLPSPPAANAWPGLHPGYPPAPPVSRAARGATASRTRGGYLAPAPIQGLEKLDPRQPGPMADLPGPSLPASREGAPRRRSRGAAPVLPSVTDAGEARPTAAEAPAAPAAAAPAQPPSASISIQPLDDAAAAAARGPRSAPTPPERPASLMDALRHEQMAAYYRRQGDDQAAYGEYQYARDLFRRIQERGGREAAIAAQGAAAAQYGMSRLQGP